MAGFHLMILAPKSKVFDGNVDSLTLPTKAGEIGVLPEHYPLISAIPTGILHFVKEGKPYYYAISGGVISVQQDKTLLLAEAIEKPSEIDRERALRAKARAEARLSAAKPDIDMERAEAALVRALNRIKAYDSFR